MPVCLYPKQCPALPHVSPKFPRSVRLCPKMTSYNFLLSDWLTTNALMIDGLYLETRESTLSVDVWNAPVGFGESLAITWRMLWSKKRPTFPQFTLLFRLSFSIPVALHLVNKRINHSIFWDCFMSCIRGVLVLGTLSSNTIFRRFKSHLTCSLSCSPVHH